MNMNVSCFSQNFGFDSSVLNFSIDVYFAVLSYNNFVDNLLELWRHSITCQTFHCIVFADYRICQTTT